MTRRHAILIPALALGAQAPSDDIITDLVRRRLASDPDVKGGGLSVDSVNGVVTIRGDVELPKHREKAEKLARKVKGVKKVVNELRAKRSASR
ncbi:MAG: BON domain-containing protein [Bryobacteraceae bacterium]